MSENPHPSMAGGGLKFFQTKDIIFSETEEAKFLKMIRGDDSNEAEETVHDISVTKAERERLVKLIRDQCAINHEGNGQV
jgi:hypothetical protein